MRNLLRRSEKEALNRAYGENVLLRVLKVPGTKAGNQMTRFRFSCEQLFYECMRVVDVVKENESAAREFIRGLWDELYSDYRDMDEREDAREEIGVAVDWVVVATMIFLSYCDWYWTNTLIVELSMSLGEKSRNYSHIQDALIANLVRVGEEDVRQTVRDYMESDEFISDDIENLLGELPTDLPQVGDDDTVTNASLSYRQIIIFLQTYLDVSLTAEYTNISAFAKFASALSGKSANTFRTKINELAHEGYEGKQTQQDINKLVELIKATGSKKWNLLENNK